MEEHLLPGDIILVKKNNIFGKIVGWFTNSKYSHAALVYSYPIVIHSSARGVHPWDSFSLEPYDVFRLKDNSIFHLDLKVTCDKIIEREIDYDYKQLIAYSYYALVGGRNKLNSPKRYICSELIDKIYHQLGYNLCPNKPKGDITPADLAQSKLLKRVN